MRILCLILTLLLVLFTVAFLTGYLKVEIMWPSEIKT